MFFFKTVLIFIMFVDNSMMVLAIGMVNKNDEIYSFLIIVFVHIMFIVLHIDYN
jgi:hypothetical protein